MRTPPLRTVPERVVTYENGRDQPVIVIVLIFVPVTDIDAQSVIGSVIGSVGEANQITVSGNLEVRRILAGFGMDVLEPARVRIETQRRDDRLEPVDRNGTLWRSSPFSLCLRQLVNQLSARVVIAIQESIRLRKVSLGEPPLRAIRIDDERDVSRDGCGWSVAVGCPVGTIRTSIGRFGGAGQYPGLRAEPQTGRERTGSREHAKSGVRAVKFIGVRQHSPVCRSER